MPKSSAAQLDSYDVVVVGTGAAGLSAAVSARSLGLSTLLIEASPYIGGSTSRSGGVIWIPANPYRTASPRPDQPDDAIAYIRAEAGDYYDEDAARLFVQSAGHAVQFLARHGGLSYTGPTFWPDYHPFLDGAREGGRSMRIDEFDGRTLGDYFNRLRPPLASMTLFGGMMVSGNDLYHLLRARRSFASALHVLKILSRHALDRISYSRGTRLCNGSALVGRLLYRYLELGGELMTETALVGIQANDLKITACSLQPASGPQQRIQCEALVLAGGGLGRAHDLRHRLGAKSATPASGSISLSPDSVRGETIEAALAIGARIDARQHDIAAWVPVSEVPDSGNFFPHFFDRSKPGFIMIDETGQRFVNEASSYHDIGAQMKQRGIQTAHIIFDHRALSRYGVGVVAPGTFRLSKWVRSGYLIQADTIEALAGQIGVQSDTLSACLQQYNRHAQLGSDPQFHKGESPYDRYIGDAEHRPNPCVAPIENPPFYAVKTRLGDIGTFCGLATTPDGLVLSHQNSPFDGLYAVGNDRASLFGGTYPAAGITLGPALAHGVIAAHRIAKRPWPPAP